MVQGDGYSGIWTIRYSVHSSDDELDVAIFHDGVLGSSLDVVVVYHGGAITMV